MPVLSVQAVRSSRPSSARPIGVLISGAGWLALVGGANAQAPPVGVAGFSAAQAKRGGEIYAGSCSTCHGDSLDDGQFAPALKGPAHAAYWRGKTAADLMTYMVGNMPPTQPGGLGAQAYADIAAYLLQADRAVPGDKEFPSDSAALRGFAPTP